MDDKNIQPIRPEGEGYQDQSQMFSILFGQQSAPTLSDEQQLKVDAFEKGLTQELHPSDSIDEAVTKMVRMALAIEFGATLTRAKGAKKMIEETLAEIAEAGAKDVDKADTRGSGAYPLCGYR